MSFVPSAPLSLPPVPRLLFDGWSYQDYMSVLGSEDEIEELGSELVDVAKVSSFLCSALTSLQQSTAFVQLV